MYPRNHSPSDAIMLDAPPRPGPPAGRIVPTRVGPPPPASHFGPAVSGDPRAPHQFPPHAHPARHAHHHGRRPHSGAPSPSSARFAPYYAASLHHAQPAAPDPSSYPDGAFPPTQPPHRSRRPSASGSLLSNHPHDYINPHYYAHGASGAGIFPYPPPPPPPYHPSMDDDLSPDPLLLDNVQLPMQCPPTAAHSAISFSTSGGDGSAAAFDEYHAPFHAAKSPLHPPVLRSNPLAALLGPIPHPHPRPSDFTAVERPPTPPHFKPVWRRHRQRGASNGSGVADSAAAGNGAETGSSFTSNSTTSSSSMNSTRSSSGIHPGASGNHHDRGRRHSYPAAALNPIASTYSAPGHQHASESTDHAYARHHPGTSGPVTTAHGHNTAPLALLSVTCSQLAYITNAHGDVISIEGNGSVWDSYVDQGLVHPFMDASPLACYPLILGRNLFDFIVCGKMQALMKHMLIISSNAQRSRLNYHWYSETDTIERKLRITLTRLSALMPNTSTPSTIRLTPRSSSAAITSAAAADAAPPLPVVFSWTVTILSERVKSPAEWSIAAHLTSPPLPVATPHSRAMCLLCKRVQVDRHELSQDAWLDFAGPQRVVSDTHPVYERDGYTPILGHRGRLGMQIASAVQAGLAVWLTGGQVAAYNASAATTADGEAASVEDDATTTMTSSSGSSSGAVRATSRRRPVQAPLCVTPVHVGVCEVCRLDVLQFFSPMYTPIVGGWAESVATE